MAGPDPALRPIPDAPQKPLTEWIQDLSNDQFKVREQATREIWEMGEVALPALRAVEEGSDPEAAHRARELVRKIGLFITPETDPEVVRLVERYAKASVGEKRELITQMQRKRAWRQILRLFADEKNPDSVKGWQDLIGEIAVTAARERLVADDPAGAKEYLEMAPANASGLLSLAEFHRSQGTLDAELARAKTLTGKVGAAWQLALYRASGNLEAAREAADAADETAISAILSMLQGDPVPWLTMNSKEMDNGTGNKTYTRLALERWQGKMPKPADLEPLIRGLGARDLRERMGAVRSLYLLGEGRLAESTYLKASSVQGFSHLEALERIPEALAAFGLDPDTPDYKSWVMERFGQFGNQDEDPDLLDVGESEELLVMANFMDRRGMTTDFNESFGKPLADLARQDEESFLEFMGRLFSGIAPTMDGSPDMARQIGYEWAGKDANRWDDLFHAAFGSDGKADVVWNWMLELDPEVSQMDRFDAMLALSEMGTDPMHLREKWLKLAWQAVEKVPQDERKEVLEKMAMMVEIRPDVANNLKLWDVWPKDERDGFFQDSRISEMTIAGRWDEAADFFLKQNALIRKLTGNASPSVHASAAACLRRAGRLDEAAIQDSWVDKLALGQDAAKISFGYRFGDDFEHSMQWLERAVRQDKPIAFGSFYLKLREYAEHLLDTGRWKEAAAMFEVSAQLSASNNNDRSNMRGWAPITHQLSLRLEADLARGLSILDSDREAAIALLQHAYDMLPGDGTLADYFFPCIRRMGLIQEHDAWFKISWDRLAKVAAEYPASSNTLNTLSWLGAKAMRNLDQAREFEKQALDMKPDEPNYLDTMAEIEFASGNREKAIEWSTKAVNFTPGNGVDGFETELMESFLFRQQHERFRLDPLEK